MAAIPRRFCLACRTPLRGSGWACTNCGESPAVVDGIVRLLPTLPHGHDGFDESLFKEYDALSERHFWFTGRRELILETIGDRIGAFGRYLEIGCGNGFVLQGVRQAYPKAELWGCDPSLEGLRLAARRVPDAHLLQFDARRVPFADTFDLIAAFDVLEHVDEDVAALREMHRACRSGGAIMLTVPQHPWLWSTTDEIARHKRRYTRGELVRKVQAAGFRVEYVTSFMSLLLPAMLVSRWMQRRIPPRAGAIDQGFRIGPVANGLCSALFRVERALLAAGVRLPVGGSLLTVARKATSFGPV